MYLGGVARQFVPGRKGKIKHITTKRKKDIYKYKKVK
jgi:hypothetical protein